MDNNVVTTLANDWKDAGVNKGDTLLLHSSISRTLKRIKEMGEEPKPKLVIESFLQTLGAEGTLIMPLFNFEFTNGVTFDIKNTPSHMGALTEEARKWTDVVRTGHPIYSFAIIGKNSDCFTGLENYSGYGPDSPFAILHKLNGKIGVLDLDDQHSMTFYHYVEENQNVTYRYHKTFIGNYIDSDGVNSIKTFGLFVRDLNMNVVTQVNPMGEILWNKKLYKGNRPYEGSGLRTISSGDLFKEVVKVIQSGQAKGILYDSE